MGNVTTAGLGGAINGAAGIVGLSNFWSPLSTGALSQATSALQATQDYWNKILSQCQYTLSQDQQAYLGQQIQATVKQQQVTNELFSEQIAENRLVIGLLAALIFFLIIYTLI